MRRRFLLEAFGIGSLQLAIIGVAPVAAQGAGKLQVIASFTILADLVRAVGGDAVAIDTLVGPDGDVHVYEPRPRDLRAVMAAGVLVRNGLGLEGWMDRLTGAAGFKGKVVVAAEKVIPRPMKEDGGVLATDPHAWQNPANAILYVQAIRDGLAAVDPANAGIYHKAADRYVAQLMQVDAWIEAQLAAVPADRRKIITTHDAFGYYGARYGIEFLSAEGISTEFEPSAKAIAALVGQIKRENVRVVFIENMTSPRMARMLAKETGAVLGGTVYSDALSPAGGPAATYLDMLRYNTTLFAAAMRS